MVKIGVFGAGHLGKIHMKCIGEVPELQLVGFYDPDDQNADQAIERFGVHRFSSMEELIDACDAIDIVTPTITHFDCAQKCLRKFRHVFVEKPITTTVDEAKILMNLAAEAKVIGQVGHVERFNPAFRGAIPFFQQPMFIECHRLAVWNPRGTDVSVVLDLMIHDIDIILSVVKSNIKRISASGVAVVSDSPDISNARIEFDNGCVANLTASRISLKNMRKTRFFQRDAYISVDFLEKKSEVVRMKQPVGEPDPFAFMIDLGGNKGKREIFFEKPDIKETNAIRDELQSFAQAIMSGTQPPVTLSDGLQALDVAYKVIEKMEVTSGIS
ncbi:MAG: Gfo/Idh/MocA family oxidoreductase [Flavobacteriales bacterium]|nr:Gfo/Idh/MocA family oxidoreductase [Flavobacteriales bacterium]